MAGRRKVSRKRASTIRKKISKRQSSAQQLQSIEKLLGEDFESLSEAKRALRDSTGPRPGKKTYTVRELSSKSHATIKEFISDIENHTDEIDSLKDDDEGWAAEVFGYKTYKVYGSIGDLAKQLSNYHLEKENPKKAIDRIKIVRIGNVIEWSNAKKKEIADRKQAYQTRIKKQRRKESKSNKRIKKLERKNTKSNTKIKTLERRLKAAKDAENKLKRQLRKIKKKKH